MPTKKQLHDRWATGMRFPSTRHTDDPNYISPEKFAQMQKDEEKINSDTNCGWVSVKADLPEYDEYVLWYLEDGNMSVEALDKDGNPWLLEDSEIEGFPLPKATHWRRLPEAPTK